MEQCGRAAHHWDFVQTNPSGNQGYQSVEETADPHAGLDETIEKEKMCDPQNQEALSKRVGITQADLKKYGYSEGWMSEMHETLAWAPQDQQVPHRSVSHLRLRRVRDS